MKNLRFHFLIILIISLLFCSCKKNEKQDENFIYTDTNFYKLIIKNFYLNYDHLVIGEESKNKIITYAIKGYGDTEKYTPLEIDKVILNLDNEQIEVKRVFTIKKNIRATDILIDQKKDLFISYITKNDNFQFYLKIDKLKKTDNYKKKQTIFYTPLINSPLSIVESGGKMVELNNNYLLLSVGDFGKKDKAQDHRYLLGKILKINKKSGKVEIYSLGHRNPQGLLKSPNNVIFETEHAEKGGDEINIISYKNNYGWPIESYGVPYNFNKENYHLKLNNNLLNLTKPIFAFMPDIGIKSIEFMNSDQKQFTLWRDNLIICSQKNIFRIKIEDTNKSRVAYTEKLENFDSSYNYGCRDLVITDNGTIITNNFKVIKSAY